MTTRLSTNYYFNFLFYVADPEKFEVPMLVKNCSLALWSHFILHLRTPILHQLILNNRHSSRMMRIHFNSRTFQQLSLLFDSRCTMTSCFVSQFIELPDCESALNLGFRDLRILQFSMGIVGIQRYHRLHKSCSLFHFSNISYIFPFTHLYFRHLRAVLPYVHHS